MLRMSTKFGSSVATQGAKSAARPKITRVANPTIARQTEIGVKQELSELNATVSAAVFNIDQQDGVVFDASTGVNKQRQLDLNSRGFELEANGSLDNGWSWIASYTYLRMKIVDGAAGTNGNELSATPNHVVSLWGHYKVEDGAFAGWGLGSGVRYLSSSYGDDQNSFKNKARAFVDAAVSYDFSALDKDMGMGGAELERVARRHVEVDEGIRHCATGPAGRRVRGRPGRAPARPRRGTGRRRGPGRRPRGR